MKKEVLLFLLVIFCVTFILIFGYLPHSNQSQLHSQTPFLDHLFAFILGSRSEFGYYRYISCQPDFIIFNINLNKGETYRYKIYTDIVLNSSYFIKEYNTSTKCYTIEYETQKITTASYYHSENLITGENITSINITIASENGTFSLCNDEYIPCIDYMMSRETPFFGLIDKNLKIIATSKEYVKHRWGIYNFEGDFYPKTTISVDEEHSDVYIVKRVVETVKTHEKNVSIGTLFTSYFWIDKNTGMLIKQVDYGSDGNKRREIQLIES